MPKRSDSGMFACEYQTNGNENCGRNAVHLLQIRGQWMWLCHQHTDQRFNAILGNRSEPYWEPGSDDDLAP